VQRRRSDRPRRGSTERPIFDRTTPTSRQPGFDRALSAGTELLSQGNPTDARIALEKALRYKPRNQRRASAGAVLFKIGELPRAEEIYRSLIETTPPIHPACESRAVFLKQNASARCGALLRDALDLAPDHQKAQNYLGLALSQKGELARAREWFLKAGNDAMADRMAQALQQSPIRGVPTAPPPPWPRSSRSRRPSRRSRRRRAIRWRRPSPRPGWRTQCAAEGAVGRD